MSHVKSPYVHAVVGILKNNNRILIAQRPEGKAYGGYWEFPGGKIEANERPIDALKRELQEELGIEVTETEPWFEHIHVYPDKTVLLDIWLVRDYKGRATSNEGQALKWANFAEIMALPLLEGNLPIMERIKTLFEI